ncbi:MULTISPECIES: biofilm peroxide resistance protein BsmA [Escherichia]|uniref:YdgH/BhsA/McbA-like domain-containing protein n=1 Tax=Escherichia fergusonii (strain ATCC 35469 / DSM 13698 / CCUG 18766 / IAM 14443 / JCM 21226 / LMG 7866 / NBRC 102419 / NCTC 12128 / CDC 0568-73) TaxID=585054 RepID=B7LLX1_ESCF3|nr:MULTISPECIES: biofilm peroxide resistance protein BsmA [Escherichia]MCU8649297.1 biofilm peroxide resistance protein BsmA [Escherichia coli]AXM04616.1 biofilm peroxide resistance protein BsmA [Escherichia fergusonii]EFF0768603.1 biofilm peroxide resistance protein BsmA [Escherichia fergusonii]EFL4494072.1 biofilm peroxide resistance protein BsmA [Escherichia fergusonii]EFL4508701.1 biofilm peroxide resistance protein BsmA [Escherichia fergusonii]
MAIRKRERVMLRFAALILVLLLSGCSALQGTPQPAPPVADHPQEIRRDQTQGLQRMGTVSAMVHGSPDDALAEIRAKAAAAKADYYVVIMVDETIVTGQWYSQAILYRQNTLNNSSDRKAISE